MRSAAGFHPNEARWQAGHQIHQLLAPYRLAQYSLPGRVDPVHREHILCDIDPDGSTCFMNSPPGFD
jgi:hypothetical protein